MRYKAILIVLVFALFALVSAQQATTPPPAKGSAPGPHHDMAAMHQQHMAGCKPISKR